MASPKSIDTFVAGISSALFAPIGEIPDATRTVRRKVSQVLSQCGRKAVSQRFIADLAGALKAADIFVNRPLLERALPQTDWLTFSNRPFAPEAVLFSKERELLEFILGALDVIPELTGLREVSREFKLGTRQRIDILCEEIAQSGKGDLVAIELKRGDPGYGVKAQLDAYLSELKRHPKARGRQVRGIIISGPDADARSAAEARTNNRIDWYFYRLRLEKAPSAAAGVTGIGSSGNSSPLSSE